MKILLPFLLVIVLAGCAHSPGQGKVVSQKEIDSRLGLAEMYLVEAEPRMALEQLRTIEHDAKNNPMLFFLLGITHELLNDLSRSAAAYERAVELAPYFGDAWNNMGQVRQAMGEFEASRHAYEQALGLEDYMTPEFAAYNLASLLAEQGKLDQALAYSSLGLEKNRRYIPLYQQKADILRRTGRSDEAVTVLQAGISNRPDDVTLMLVLAEELIRLDRDVEAKRMFARIIEQDPGSDEAETAAHYLEVIR